MFGVDLGWNLWTLRIFQDLALISIEPELQKSRLWLPQPTGERHPHLIHA